MLTNHQSDFAHGIHLRAISQEMLKISILDMSRNKVQITNEDYSLISPGPLG